MYVILLGPPGAGKGTQGVLLAEAQGWERVVSGDLLRRARSDGTALGREAKRFMDAGELVPDDVVVAMVRDRLACLGGAGVIIDGFPRTKAQASGLNTMLAPLGLKIDEVVVLEAEDEPLIERIAGRRSCPRCGAVYNVFLAPSSRDGVCDHDGTLLEHRSDDHRDTVQNRLDVYRHVTAPLIEYYDTSGIPVHRIDADQTVEEVQGAVAAALGLPR